MIICIYLEILIFLALYMSSYEREMWPLSETVLLTYQQQVNADK